MPCPFLRPTARGLRCVLLSPEDYRSVDSARCRSGNDYHSCVHYNRIASLPRERFARGSS